MPYENDDYIENDTKQNELRRSIMPFDFLSLELRLELQEEADFQKRFEKQQEAIEKVKQIAEARFEYNQNWLDGVKKGELTSKDYINTFVISDIFLKKPKTTQEKIISNIEGRNWTEGLKNDKNFFKNILDIINSNAPYFLDIIYLKIYTFNSHEKSPYVSSGINSQNHELKYSSKMLKILDPFLTKEFKCFFSKIQHCSVFDGSKQSTGCSIFNVTKHAINTFICLHNNIIDWIGKNGLLLDDEKMALFFQWKDNADKTLESVYASDLQIQTEIRNKINREHLVVLNLMETDVIEKVRANFSLLYNLTREAEEIKNFIDNINCKKKIRIKRPVVMELHEEIIETVETIPSLDEIFVSDDSRNGLVDDFFALKKQQLFLWQKKVEQRKAQKEEQVQIQRACFEDKHVKEKDTVMERQHAEQLLALYSNLDKDSKDFYLNCFDSVCKPQNMCFRDIEKLVRSFGGTLKKNTGSSHFPIRLPNTNCIWEHAQQTLGVKSYLDAPKVTGGSYKPHHISDKWSHSAHYFFKQAFIKAGITPERLAMAEQMLRSCVVHQELPVQSGEVKNQEVRKVNHVLNLK